MLQIIELAISSVRAIRQLPAHIEATVVRAYINSLTWTFGKYRNSHLFALSH